MTHKAFEWTGVQLPVIGQGTWMIEGSPEKERRAVEALRLGLDLGLTHIDTAEMYGNGRAEELVGEAISGRREEVFLVSKVLPSNASYEGSIRACEESLRRLRVDYLDLYLLHWQGRYPLPETMRAFESLQRSGKVRYFGVSNFDVEDLKRAESALGEGRIASNQVLYHLGDRGVERRLIPYCRERQIALDGYSPFHQGKLPKRSSRGGEVLEQQAARLGMTPRQLILRFLVRDSAVFVIPKASTPEHVRENAAALELDLDELAISAIDQAFPLPDRDAPLGML